MNYFFIFITNAIILNLHFFTAKNILEIESLKEFFKSSKDFYEVESLITTGQMKGYWKTSEYFYLIKLLKQDYPNIIQIDTIGTTFYNNPIYKISFVNKAASSGILFTGIHHAREPVSLLMNIYLIFKILFEIHMENVEYLELLQTRNLHFIPLLNVDGFHYNVILFESIYIGEFGLARKNRRNGSLFQDCEELSYGVDLNRNYGYKFNNSEKSSSSNPCAETYRGVNPFSEPETLSIKNFVDNSPDIKIAYNYHTFGNFYIIPYSFLDDPFNKLLEENNSLLYLNYKEFENENIFPKYNRFGNTIYALSYSSDGEASDWMMAEKGILAFSPELGNSDFRSETFYPDISTSLEICRENLAAGIYGVQKSGFLFLLNNRRNFNFLNDYYYYNNNDHNSTTKIENFNNNRFIYFEECKNRNDETFAKILKNEINLIYFDEHFDSVCGEHNEQLFYSIGGTIRNSGLGLFVGEAKLKIRFSSSGIERMIGNLVTFNYANMSLTRNLELLDTKYDGSFPSTYVEFIRDRNINTFNYSYSMKYLGVNDTLVLDLKCFTGKNEKEKVTFDLIVDFVYKINENIQRNFTLIKLNKDNFLKFNENNIFSTNIFNQDSIYNVYVLESEGEIGKNKKPWIIYISVILSVMILSLILLVLFRKKNFKKKDKNGNLNLFMEMNNKIELNGDNIKKNEFQSNDLIKSFNKIKIINSEAIISKEAIKDEFMKVIPIKKTDNNDKSKINISDKIDVITINDNYIHSDII